MLGLYATLAEEQWRGFDPRFYSVYSYCGFCETEEKEVAQTF